MMKFLPPNLALIKNPPALFSSFKPNRFLSQRDRADYMGCRSGRRGQSIHRMFRTSTKWKFSSWFSPPCNTFRRANERLRKKRAAVSVLDSGGSTSSPRIRDRDFKLLFTCGKADRSSRDKFSSSFFLLSRLKKRPNQFKQGSICSLGNRFQIWCQIWPPRLSGGDSGLITSFSLLGAY